MESTKGNKNVSVSLSNDEALVLLEWLCNFIEEEHPSLFQDQAEERVLWDLKAVLEKVISVTFDKDYINILSQARENIRDSLD